jgi:hypothetical protein
MNITAVGKRITIGDRFRVHAAWAIDAAIGAASL